LYRSAKVLCKNKIITRAIALLYPLELTIEDEEKNKELEINNSIDSHLKGNPHPMALRERKRINYNETDNADINFLIDIENNIMESAKICMYFEDEPIMWRPCKFCGGPHMDYDCDFQTGSSHDWQPREKSFDKKFKKQDRQPRDKSYDYKYKTLEDENKILKREIKISKDEISKLKIDNKANENLINNNKVEISHLQNELKETKLILNNVNKKITELEKIRNEEIQTLKIQNERLNNDFKRIRANSYLKDTLDEDVSKKGQKIC